MAVDTIGRLTAHLLGAAVFQSGDVRARQEVRAKAKLAMDQARGEALMMVDPGVLEESRRKLAKEAVKREQDARDQQAKAKRDKATQEQLELFKKEAERKAEDAQRVEARGVQKTKIFEFELARKLNPFIYIT